MDDTFRRDYLVRLPLPLAQLYSRAHNAKQARSRHDNAFYLCESLIKLTATPAILTYLRDTRHGLPRCAGVDSQLDRLTLPSLGHWLGFVRELAKYFGERVDAASHPLGHLQKQLSTKRQDWVGVLQLYRRIKNGPDGQPSNNKSCSALELFDALVQYRNTVFGHGASRAASFYEEEMGPLLLPAISELLDEGVLDILGPRGSRLIFLTEIRSVGERQMEVEFRELTGRESERSDPIRLSAEDAEVLAPQSLAVLWPGIAVPQRLDPLLTFRETELTEEVLFLNRDRSGKQVEYLSYTTGQTVRDREMGPALQRLLAEVPRSAPEEQSGQTKTGDETAVGRGVDDTVQSSGVQATLDPARKFQDFEILAELGRGGMGVVYVAKQLSLGRLVALKTLSADLLGDEIALARFRREMRVLGRCDHANIVKVYSCGALPDGQLYYAMEYVPGADLERVWRELADADESSGDNTSVWASAVRSASTKQLEQTRSKSSRGEAIDFSRADLSSPKTPSGDATQIDLADTVVDIDTDSVEDLKDYQRRVAALIRDAAQALQVVHDQKVVHRDVKPANLILTADGSRVVLMDFGLAKGQETTALTATNASGLLGTLRYSAPEQLASANVGIGPPADVRGLGTTMWELLTKRRLFGEAEDERQLATWVLNRDVPLLRTVNPAMDVDLEAIVAKATDRNVETRIQKAGELADLLDAYIAGKPVDIGRPNRWGVFLTHCAIPIVVVCALFPNAVAGLFNLLYNRDEIITHMGDRAESIFWVAQSVINGVAYPIGVFMVGLMAFRATRPVTRGGAEATTPDEMRRARRYALLMGHYTAIIGVVLWSLAGLAYPVAIHSTSGEMSVKGYVHFFGSLIVCGMVAAAYPYFLITWYSLSTVYPLLSRGHVYATEDRDTLQQLNVWNWRYFICAAAVPMTAVSILVTIESDSKLAVGVFAFGGLCGFAFAASAFRRIQSYLANQI